MPENSLEQEQNWAIIDADEMLANSQPGAETGIAVAKPASPKSDRLQFQLPVSSTSKVAHPQR